MEKIIGAAIRCFRQLGLKKTSVSSICEEAGVSRVTFYQYYRSKTDLAIQILEEMEVTILKGFSERFEGNPWETLHWLFTEKKRMNDILGSRFIDEWIISKAKEITNYIAKKRKESETQLRQLYEKLYETPHFDQSISFPLFNFQLQQITKLLTDPHFAVIVPEEGERFEKAWKLALFGLLKGVSDVSSA